MSMHNSTLQPRAAHTAHHQLHRAGSREEENHRWILVSAEWSPTGGGGNLTRSSLISILSETLSLSHSHSAHSTKGTIRNLVAPGLQAA